APLHRHDPVPTGSPLERPLGRPRTGQPDGDTRRLARLGKKAHVVDLEMTSAVIESLALPETGDDLQGLIQPFSTLPAVRGVAERRVFAETIVACSHTQDQ